MSNRIKINSNKSNVYGILIAIASIILVSILSISISGAWFTDNKTLTKESATPAVAIQILDANNLALAESGDYRLAQEIDLTDDDYEDTLSLKIKIDSNINVYLRAKFSIYCYRIVNDSEVVLGKEIGVESTNYFGVTYNSASVWKNNVTGHSNEFYYYCESGTTTLDALETATLTGNTQTVNFLAIERYESAIATAVADGIHVKLQVFAEAVQANNAGLAKW